MQKSFFPDWERHQDEGTEPKEAPQDGAVLCSVLLPLPVDEPYSYRLPKGLRARPQNLEEGTVVQVPVGSRVLCGVIWPASESRRPKEVAERTKIKPVFRVPPCPPLPRDLLRTVAWIADYTLAPLGSVLKMALSVPEAFWPERDENFLTLSSRSQGQKITAARQKVLSFIEKEQERKGGALLSWRKSDLAKAAGVSVSVLAGMEKNGLLTLLRQSGEAVFSPLDTSREGPVLSPDQARATKVITSKIDENTFAPILLDGVTGSGKTEVYFEAIEAAVKKGRQVLVLLPEIALSSQWIVRFEERFGAAPTQWHSDLTAAQRRKTWRAVARGRTPVVVGARSALFLPFPDLGLMIVDEEHEAAFKQEEGVRYHGRDMAVVRARQAGVPIILASATPSLETMMNAQSGRYQHLVIPARHGGALLPVVSCIDLRKSKPPRRATGRDMTGEGLTGVGWLAPALRRALEATFEAGDQALLFLNRRGYAPLTLCRSCGHRLQCPNCDAWLVEHRSQARLQCHHCGYQRTVPQACPSCEAPDNLVHCGPGVERVAEEAAQLFPDIPMTVMASDTLTSPGVTATLMERIQKKEVQLLIGTQVVAKGYHFPDLTTVGVVDADLGLFGGDLRAAERTFQLMHQVAGRAGRAQKRGNVYLQTTDPDHPVMQALVAADRDGFYQLESENRARGGLPPFGCLGAVIISGKDQRLLDGFCRQMAQSIPLVQGVDIMGPLVAPLAILRGRHRRRFLVQAKKGRGVQRVMRHWLERARVPPSLKVTIDIDPYSFL